MPIEREEIKKIARKYTLDGYPSISIAALGSHSMLDIARGALNEGFRTIAICKKGREKTYDKYFKFRKRGEDYVGCINETIILDDWKDIVSEKVLNKLLDYNSIFIPHRSAEVYLGYDIIENSLKIPLFGNRMLLRAEERTKPWKIEKNQDYLVKLAELSTPKKFSSIEKVNKWPVMVKATKAIGDRPFQRAGDKISNLPFPVVSSTEEYETKCREFVRGGKTDKEKKLIEENFRTAPIEEYMPGKKLNLNFFYSVIHDELEFLGSDTRTQFPNGEEFTHAPKSLRESLLEKIYAMGEKFVEVTKKVCPPGIIGPFALQTVADENENLLVYDSCFRIPGSPDTEFTPYTGYLYGKPISFGRRIAMEIKEAIKNKRLEEIVI